MEDDLKRRREMARLLVNAMILIGDILAALPLKIVIPAAGTPECTPATAVKILERARLELIDAQPISDGAKMMLKVMILEWFALVDISGRAAQSGASERRLDTARHQADLIMSASDHVAEELGLPPFLE